jgi:hypothetical protein
MYCMNCRRVVGPIYKRDRFHPMLFLVMAFLTVGLSSIVWIPIWLCSSKPHCPICNGLVEKRRR